MARAYNIFVVLDENRRVVKAFTVKHEMVSWMKVHGEPWFVIAKLRDGPRGTPEFTHAGDEIDFDLGEV